MPLIGLKTERDLRVQLLRLCDERLPGFAGQLYASAVRACLDVSGHETFEEGQTLLCWEVAGTLDKCVV
jgi:hypothetical protein